MEGELVHDLSIRSDEVLDLTPTNVDHSKVLAKVSLFAMERMVGGWVSTNGHQEENVVLETGENNDQPLFRVEPNDRGRVVTGLRDSHSFLIVSV